MNNKLMELLKNKDIKIELSTLKELNVNDRPMQSITDCKITVTNKNGETNSNIVGLGFEQGDLGLLEHVEKLIKKI